MSLTNLPSWFHRKPGRHYFVVSNEDDGAEILRTTRLMLPTT